MVDVAGGEWRLLVVDGSLPLTSSTARNFYGYISEELAEWIHSVVTGEDRRPVVLATHYPTGKLYT